jgi:4a-hydroxytetrahydrobiopterin dehydratase
LKGEALQDLHAQLGPEWSLEEEHHLERTYRFPDFRAALAFTNRIGEVSEEQGHHPDIRLGWGYVSVTLYTHKIDGLTESDFILAAKFDRQHAGN